jgi:hypothetical protein
VDAERGEGDGSRFASKVAEKQITSMKNLKGMGKMIPLEMPLPAGKGQVMKMIPEVIRCHPGMLELGGKLEVVSKGGQRDGGQRDGGSREGQ